MKTMKRIFVSLLAVMMLLLCLAPAAMAAGTVATVDITKKHDGFFFQPGSSYSKTDLFPNFKDVMPGDKLTQEVRITHKAIGLNSLKVYLRVIPHDSAEFVSGVTREESARFLSQLNMTIRRGKKVLFQGHPNENGGLEEFTYIGPMHKGSSITLTVELEVPIEMGNDFADKIGEMDWEFRIDEIPSTIPKTGDESNIGLMMTICITSLVALILVVFFLIRKKKKNS